MGGKLGVTTTNARAIVLVNPIGNVFLGLYTRMLSSPSLFCFLLDHPPKRHFIAAQENREKNRSATSPDFPP